MAWGAAWLLPVPSQSVRIPEQKNGEVAAAPMGTGSISIGTGNAPVGTASITLGTGNTPVGTAKVTLGTGNVEMPSVPVGTASTPSGTASAPMGMANPPMGMPNTPMGTAITPMGTANSPMGTASVPTGMANASMGMPSAPMGTASTSMGSASVPMGMPSEPMGMPSAPVGTASTPLGTASTPLGTASSPVGTATPSGQAQNGARSRQYYEVHLTLAKPKPVKNRTARPFGTQTPATPSQGPEGVPSQPPERAPPAPTELPPPPTYAETLGSPPPLSRVRSPPAYSALYPPVEQKVLQSPVHGAGAVPPLPKTGILEESAARRAHKKSMFTFVEKPKLGPNPDLLDLVQSADSRKKQKEHGEPGAEDEPFALGAEASNFVPSSAGQGRAAPRTGRRCPGVVVLPQIPPHPAQTQAPAQPQPHRSQGEGGRAVCPPAVPHGEVHHRGSLPARPAALPVAHHVPASLLEVRRHRLPLAHGLQAPRAESLQALQNPPGVSLRRPGGERGVPEGAGALQAPALPAPAFALHPLPIQSPTEGRATAQTLSSRRLPLPAENVLPGLSIASFPRLAASCRRGGLQPLPWCQRGSAPASEQPPHSRSLGGAAAGLAVPPSEGGLPGAPALLLHQERGDRGAGQAHVPPRLTHLDAPICSGARAAWTAGPARPRCPSWTRAPPGPRRGARGPCPRCGRTPTPGPAGRCKRGSPGTSSTLPAGRAPRPKPWGPRAPGPSPPHATSPQVMGSPGLPRSPRPEGCRAPAPQVATSACSVPAAAGSPSPGYKSPLPSPRVDGPRSCASPGVSRATWAEGRRLLLSPGSAGLSPTPKSPLPSPVVGARSPAKRYSSRSPTDSDVSLDSEDSGAKSPGIHSFNLCPRGWTGSLRLKPGGLPSGAPCTS
uniref:Synaptopodin n=1 Tax=Anas platyrhynchos TaxID=8839 RepID=A0A8B9SKM4_ANAPL